MIINVTTDMITTLTPLIEEMVKRENALGDQLKLAPLLESLMLGGQNLLAVFAEGEVMPMMLLVYFVTKETLRERTLVSINQIFVPSSTKLREKFDPKDKEAFCSMFKGMEVMFLTSNPKLVPFIEFMGLKCEKVQELYRVKLEA